MALGADRCGCARRCCDYCEACRVTLGRDGCQNVRFLSNLCPRAIFIWMLSPMVTSAPAAHSSQLAVCKHFLGINPGIKGGCTYLCCVWLEHLEPCSRLERPGSTPPSGSESSLALVSGCRCGFGLRWAKLTGPVSLWCPAAGAGRVKEPRTEYLAPCR